MSCDCKDPTHVHNTLAPEGPTFTPVPAFDVCQIGTEPADRIIPHTTYIRLASTKYRLTPEPTSDSDKVALNDKMSHLGYLFLQQTRLRPSGSVIGEPVFTLSLAPQETVVLTQKSWTKRKQSLEELAAYEIEHSFERSSTLSSELSENLEHELENSSKFSLNASVSGSYGFAGFGIQASLGTSYDTSTAEKSSQAHAVKQSQQRTEKASSKARSEHKTTFKVESETGSESGSRRTLRNLNTAHSLMLNYYKVFQRYQVIEERTDVRLCWAPCVKAPGQEILNRLKNDLNKAASALSETEDPDWVPKGYPPRPEPELITTKNETMTLKGPMAGSPVVATVSYSFMISTEYEYASADVRVVISSGVLLAKPIAGGPAPGTQGPLPQTITVVAQGIDPASVTVYVIITCNPTAARLARWRNDVQGPREQEIKRRRDEYDTAKKILDDAIKGDTVVAFDPLTELMRRILQTEIGKDLRDECHEVVQWHEIFDWEGMSYRLYPAWWDDGNKTVSERVNFLNASWAQLYIPVTRGCEEVATQLLLGPLAKYADAKQLYEEITMFRAANFADGAVIEMGRWFELMPTDGTYVEPVLGKCDGCDEILREEIKNHLEKSKPTPLPEP